MQLLCLTVLCAVGGALAGSDSCTVDPTKLDAVSPYYTKLVGKWYAIRWGAFLSTQMNPFIDFMMNLSPNPNNDKVLNMVAGLRDDVEDTKCQAGFGNFTFLTANQSQMFVQSKASDSSQTNFLIDETFYILEIDYSKHFFMFWCGGQASGVCPSQKVELSIWSRTPALQSSTITAMEIKMKAMCIDTDWIFHNGDYPCDGLNRDGVATCPVHMDLMPHQTDVQFSRLAGKWYQIVWAAYATTTYTAWPDYMWDLKASAVSSVLDLTASIRQKTGDSECITAEGQLRVLATARDVYQFTIKNADAQIDINMNFRVMEVDYDNYIVTGLCGDRTSGYCDPNDSELIIWSRKPYLSTDHLKQMSKWYKIMCVDDDWIVQHGNDPCDWSYNPGTTTLAAASLLPHTLTILLAVLAGFASTNQN